MANTIKVKRGTDANRAGVTPAEGELLYTTDTKKVYVGDGSTAGGNEVGGGGGSSQTPAELLADIKTVDGSGSGLDADLLDGQQGSYYAAASTLSNYLPLSGGTLTGNLIVDINGTAAGLVINSNTGTNPNAATIDLLETNVNPPTFGSSSNGFRIAYNGDVNRLEATSYTFSSDQTRLRFTIDRSSGDASFYSDDGTTQDFYWDASASSLGINTTTPVTALDVSGVITATGGNSTNWNTAYGWGDHSAAGYLASSSYTASDVLTKIKTVDGSGSGLDADLLDGQQGSYYAAASSLSNYLPLSGGTLTGALKLNGGSYSSGTDTAVAAAVIDKNDYILSDDGTYLRRVIGHVTSGNIEIGQNGTSLINAINLMPGNAGNSAVRVNGNTVWNAGNDGSGSGLDADLLDGQQGSYYAAASSLSNYTPLDHIRSLGVPRFTNGTDPNITTAQVIAEIESDGGFDSYTSAFKTSWSYAGNYNLTDAGRFTETAGTAWLTWTDNSSDTTRGNITALAIAPNTGGSAGRVFIYNDQGSSYSPGWREVWTSTSDGSGSGLDADLLDGVQGSSFLRNDATNANATFTDITLDDQILSAGDSNTYLQFHAADQWRVVTGGGERLEVNNSGIIVTGSVTASGDVTAFSDERLKSDIETLDGSKVYQMRGVSYTKDGQASSGVIAQELQKVAPELVSESGEYLSVAYGNLVGYLIEAVKELKAEVEALKGDK